MFIEFLSSQTGAAHTVAVEHIVDLHGSLTHCNGYTTTYIELANGKRLEVIGSYYDVKAKLVRAGVTFI